jgi:hypothetical protein
MNQRPMSVTIFGILNIGFGLLDLLVTLFSMFILPGINAAGNPMLKQMHDSAWTRITMPLDGIAAITLLAAGIGLLLCKNWARTISLIYSGYSILVCIGGGIATVSTNAMGLMMIMSLLGTIVGLAYPVLLIIFMMRPNVIAALKPAPPMA